MLRVLNRKTDGLPFGAIYVGRPSKWGNPFSHLPLDQSIAQFQTKTREEAIEKYRI
jgi:hypothetical protein